MSADYDLLIVGAGPAGLAAALAAAPSSARIALVDDNPAAGGQIWRDGPRASLPPRAHQMRQRLAGHANVEHFPATRVVACGPGRRLLLEDPQRGWQSATDAWSSAPAPANCCCRFPAGPSPASPAPAACRRWPKAAACHWPASAWWWLAPARCCWPAPPAPASAGRACCASPNRRRREPWPPSPYACRAGPASCGRPPACSPVATAPTATCSPPSARSAWKPCACAKAVRSARSPANAWPAASAWCPTCKLGQALGYRLDGPALAVDEWQAGSLPDHYAAGECTGFGGSGLALVEGAIAGHAAVDERDAARRLWPRRRRWQGFADALARHFALRAELRELAEADTLVCRCEDVPWPRWPGMPAGPRPSCTAVAAWAPARGGYAAAPRNSCSAGRLRRRVRRSARRAWRPWPAGRATPASDARRDTASRGRPATAAGHPAAWVSAARRTSSAPASRVSAGLRYSAALPPCAERWRRPSQYRP